MGNNFIKAVELIDARDLRGGDFKYLYANSLTLCVNAQYKAYESMTRAHESSIAANESAMKVMAVEENVSQLLDAAGAALTSSAQKYYDINFSAQANRHGDELKTALFKISKELAFGLLKQTETQATSILSEVGKELRVHLAPVDKFDKTLNGSFGVAARLNSRLESNMTTMIGEIEERLLGTNGIATKMTQKLSFPTKHLLESMNATIAAGKGLQEVLDDSRRAFWRNVGIFGAGLLIGGVFVRIFH